ncbi:MAG TPA: 50S ribosomal protein L29 [Candidatus Saccharimonadales bacterium]|nr:50S ribosomal protein L29 [Candidatus Saccharimonadales bacterium]
MADKKQKKLATIEELRKLDTAALTAKVAELKKELVEQQRAHAAQELPNPAVIGKTRKQIAQALTLLQAAKPKRGEVAEEPAKEEEK